ncbi:DUF6954 family protein [Salinibacillus xinjiangensis]|uniref:DUF3923 family protein n=1 Tax=Salinibacillus xinjiangensis TaxID=1229268 RepID=A0A6G1X4M3_9BACI|nr:hypothetical protein [Salinibacillus xinjiangensis]MRG85855.1 hypothetical protein [Salinibacillus xinjiangensis]
MHWLVYFCFLLAYILVTFFGISPVLMADGSFEEQMITLAVVIAIYIFLAWLLLLYRKKRAK